MMKKVGFLGLIALIAAPVLAIAQKPSSPAQVLRQALTPHRAALEACGVRWSGAPVRAIARFKLDFEGRVQGLRIEGVPKGNVSSCLETALQELRVPKRLAYIVREVALPLPVDVGFSHAQASR